MSGRVYLDSYLAPLEPWLNRADVTDIWINRPCEIWWETTTGQTACAAVPELTELVISRLARQIAAASSQGVSRESPLLSASLPDGSRVQIVAPPATRDGVALALRKHTLSDMCLGELGAHQVFEGLTQADRAPPAQALRRLLDLGQVEDFFRLAVELRQTIMISGGTSSGKTTLLNALIKEAPATERLILIEDAPEIRLQHKNAVGLIATRGGNGEAQVDTEDLLQAALRMRPDRIILGELRGGEAFTFLRAVNTGHPGSMTTIHADTAEGALDQVAMLALLNGAQAGWDDIRAYARQIIDVVVQLKRVNGGRRVVDILIK